MSDAFLSDLFVFKLIKANLFTFFCVPFISTPSWGIMERMFDNNQEFESEAIGKITGTIPDWLNGTLIRSGPGKWHTIV